MASRIEKVREQIEGHAPLLAMGVVALGLALRLHGLDAWWLNPDEGDYYATALTASWSGFWAEVAGNAHPPLFYLLVRAVSVVGLDLWVLRLPSLVSGCAFIYAIFLVGRAAFGSGTGLIAALLVAASPTAIVLSQLIRPYALQQAFLGFAVWLVLLYQRGRETRDLAGYAMLATLAMLTHYGSALFLASVAIWLLVLRLRGGGGRSDWLPLWLAHLPLAAVGAGVYLYHLRPHLIGGSLQTAAQQQWLSPFFHDTVADLWLATIGLHRYVFGSRYDGAAVLLLGVGLGVAWVRRRGGFALLAMIALAVAALLSLLHQYPFGGTRHSAYLAILVVPMIANAIVFAISRTGARRLGAILGLGALLALPDLARTAVGARHQRVGGQVERIATVEAIRSRDPWFRELRERPGLIVLDEQTYFFLIPHFRNVDASVRPHGDPVFRHFRWGASHVVVSSAWRLRGDAERLRDPDHLFGFILHVERELSSLRRAGGAPVQLLFGGWAPTPLRDVVRLDRQHSAALRAVSQLHTQPGLATALLDTGRLLDRLEASADVSRP